MASSRILVRFLVRRAFELFAVNLYFSLVLPLANPFPLISIRFLALIKFFHDLIEIAFFGV